MAKSGDRDPDIWFMLGTICIMNKDYEKAEQCNRRAIAIYPEYFQAQCNLGAVLREQGKPEEALQHFEKALGINPDYINAHINRGGAFNDLGRLDEAKSCYRKALTINPHEINAHYCLAEACRITGELDDAMHHYRQVLHQNPGNIESILSLVNILKFRKQYSQANSVLEPYLNTPDNRIPTRIAVSYALLCRETGEYDKAIDLLENLRSQSTVLLNNEDRVAMYFCLGNLYDASGNIDRAFENYRTGNLLKSHGNEHLAHEHCLKAYSHLFTADFLKRTPRADNASELPVFIVGMPRSGTSLVEQILSSHPRIVGGGERKWMIEIVKETQGIIGSSQTFPECLHEIRQEHCNTLAEHYLKKLAELSGAQTARVTDKMPSNYWNLGIIALLFPKGRIIHCRRDPMDTCLSIYFQNFGEGQGFAYDLREIGQAYNHYRQMMDHWNKVLDLPILDIHYEDLVGNQESTTRRLLEFCGMPWDDNCLRFQDTDRMVFTASSAQVRRPLYRSSLRRWERYQSHLGPLIEALDAYKPE